MPICVKLDICRAIPAVLEAVRRGIITVKKGTHKCASFCPQPWPLAEGLVLLFFQGALL
jgi:hypothetical protein